MSIPSPVPSRFNFHTLHSEIGSEHFQEVMILLEENLIESQVPHAIAQVIRLIVSQYSPLFSIDLKVRAATWNSKHVYLVNSSQTRLSFFEGNVLIGNMNPINLDAGLVIYARRNYSQALWLYTKEQVSLFGIAR